MTTGTIETVSSREACDLADVTYRQIDYWARLGIAQPTQAARGSGSRRRWTLDDVVALRVVHRLMVLRVGHLVIRDALARLECQPDLLWVREGTRDVSAGDAFDLLAEIGEDLGPETSVLVISPAAIRDEVLARYHLHYNRG